MQMRLDRKQARAVARGLGWFSIALGAAELLAPRAMARATGLRGRETLLQMYGLRELAAGVGLLAAKDPTPWLWARVGGDALDIATLAAGLDGRDPERAAVAIGAVIGVTALDAKCALDLSAAAKEARSRTVDYSSRSGFPRAATEMVGAASDFEAPRDMRTPAPMRPYVVKSGATA